MLYLDVDARGSFCRGAGVDDKARRANAAVAEDGRRWRLAMSRMKILSTDRVQALQDMAVEVTQLVAQAVLQEVFQKAI